MTNLDLEILELQGARWVEIRPGTKRPQGRDWQRAPRELADVTTPAVGLRLGQASAGIAAVDFDGESAVRYWDHEVGARLPHTVMWTSTRPGRFQMAVRVPEPDRGWIPTKFAHTTAPGEQLEWRYGTAQRGFQSVMPPSAHPDGGHYEWVPGHSPQDCAVQDITEEILAWLRAHQRRQLTERVREIEPGVCSPDWNILQERSALSRCFDIIAHMQPGDRSHRACQVGGLMRLIRPRLHPDIIQRLQAAGCDAAAIESARVYSRRHTG